MKSTEKTEMKKNIVVERIKTMSPNFRIALGSKGQFLSKENMLTEIKNNTETGQKIIEIQFRYLQALKEGVV